jgi:DNA topoisomerase-1
MPRKKRLEIVTDPAESAKAAGLRYVTDTKPGIQRKPWRKSFRFLDPSGAAVRDAETLGRIKSLVIPQPGRKFGSVQIPKGISRSRAEMQEAESRAAIIRAGARCATRPSMNA